MKKTNLIPIFVLYLIGSISGVIMYYVNSVFSAIVFIVLGILLFIFAGKIRNTYLNTIGIFGLSWFASIGLACLKLQQNQMEWKTETWICLLLAFGMFLFGFLFRIKKKGKEKKPEKITKKDFSRFLLCLSILCIGAFIFEVLYRGNIPLFMDNMSSYKEFGVSGIHYFTVASCLFPPATIIYIRYFGKEIKIREYCLLTMVNIIMCLIPVAIVSRQLFIITAILSLVVFLIMYPRRTVIALVVSAILLVGGWLSISGQRNQGDDYLRESMHIQEEADSKSMQAYMYIACNYDNLDVNVGNIEQYSNGKRIALPLFALTGLKFVFPELEDTPELARFINSFTTYPMVMSQYADFGIIGIIVCMFLIGVISRIIEELNNKRPINILFKSLLLYSLALSFFANWFANATIVFYFIILVILGGIIFGRKELMVGKEGDVK